MAFDPERPAEQQIDDQKIGQAQQRMANEGAQRAVGRTAISMNDTQHQAAQNAMGSTAVQSSMAEGEEEEMSM